VLTACGQALGVVEVAGRLPRGKIVHVEGAGHNVRRENKAQTIEVMKAFLSGT
jgi:hypothetical protein